ncbi:hypothetical protein GN958_ATG19978 [Phytophthora infestans]|nr:hypothetical protein GN958_ATG19978 [Phytophthora infestans]
MLELVIAPMNNENDFVGASPDGTVFSTRSLCWSTTIKIIEVERRTSVLGTKIEAGQPAISQGVNTEVVASSLKYGMVDSIMKVSSLGSTVPVACACCGVQRITSSRCRRLRRIDGVIGCVGVHRLVCAIEPNVALVT